MNRLIHSIVHLLLAAMILTAAPLTPSSAKVWSSSSAVPEQQTRKKRQTQGQKSARKSSSKKKRPSTKKSRSAKGSTKKKSAGKKGTAAKKASQAKAYFDRAKKKLKTKDYAGALKDFQRSNKLRPSKTAKSYIQKITAFLKKRSKTQPARRVARKKVSPAQGVETAAARPKPKSIYEVSDNIYRMTYQLDASTQKIRSARLALKPLERRPRGDLTLARLEKLQGIASEQPESTNALRDLALEYEREGMYVRARDIYLRMIASDPSNPDYHYFLGALYSKMGQHHRARYAFEEALEINPNHAATINALSLYERGSSGEAMASELMQKAAVKEPEGPAHLLEQIREGLNSGDYEDVIEMALEGERRYSQNAVFPYLAGEAYRATGNLEEAKKSYKRSISLNKSDPAPTTALADLYFDQGNYLYAAITYESILHVRPMDVDLRFKHGLSYFKAYEWAKCASAWEDLLQYAPNHPIVRKMLPQAYYILSLEYNRNGFTDLSRRAFANALSVNAQSSEWLSNALDAAGEYYRENGLYRNALNAYQEAIELDPVAVDHYNGLGATYWFMGEKEMAVAAWEKSLSLRAEDNAARGWLLLAKR